MKENSTKPDIKKITFFGTLIFIALFLLQFIFPSIKRLYYPEQKPVQTSAQPQNTPQETPITPVAPSKPTPETTPSTQINTTVLGETTVKNTTPKTLEVSEQDLNGYLQGELGKSSGNSGISQINVKMYNGYAQFTMSLSKTDAISVNMSVASDKKSLKVDTYNFTGSTNYPEEVKAQMPTIMTQLFTAFLTQKIPNAEIQSILIANTKITIVYI